LEEGLILSRDTDLDKIEIEISAEQIFRIIKDDLVQVKDEIAKSGNTILEDLNSRRSKLSEQPIIDNSFLTKL
jgi:ribosomal protein L19E